MEFAEEAVQLAPDKAWSQSAKSWAYFATGHTGTPGYLAYATVVFSALSRERKARAKLDELECAWPNAPIELMVKSIHRDEVFA